MRTRQSRAKPFGEGVETRRARPKSSRTRSRDSPDSKHRPRRMMEAKALVGKLIRRLGVRFPRGALRRTFRGGLTAADEELQGVAQREARVTGQTVVVEAGRRDAGSSPVARTNIRGMAHNPWRHGERRGDIRRPAAKPGIPCTPAVQRSVVAQDAAR